MAEQNITRKPQGFIRGQALDRKIQGQSRVYHRKISKRKHYGVDTRIQEYRDLIIDAVDLDAGLRELRLRREGLDDDIARAITANTGLDQEDKQRSAELLREAFDRGARRVFNLQGEALRPAEKPSELAVQSIIDQQDEYLSNIVDEVGQVVQREVSQALQGDKTLFEAQQAIEEQGRNVTRNRAETISRSEMIKASGRGTQKSLEEMGVDQVVWVATIDNRVCPTCRDLHLSEWGVRQAPTPVSDTHPNCRCTIVAKTTES